MDNSVLLDRVRRELDRYDHLLVRFSARESAAWGMELIIELKQPPEGAHVYAAPIHPRDVEHPQFAWTFQKFLYDCLHDFLVEMFVRNPQMREERP